MGSIYEQIIFCYERSWLSSLTDQLPSSVQYQTALYLYLYTYYLDDYRLLWFILT
jgi:hypothetical protein